jgi:hypothetical protein
MAFNMENDARLSEFLMLEKWLKIDESISFLEPPEYREIEIRKFADPVNSALRNDIRLFHQWLDIQDKWNLLSFSPSADGVSIFLSSHDRGEFTGLERIVVRHWQKAKEQVQYSY